MTLIQKTKAAPAIRSGDPFAAFRTYADTLFDDMFHSNIAPSFRRAAPTQRSNEAFLSPSIDVHETEAAISLAAELPGLDEQDIDLEITDGILTLKGEKRYEREDDADARVIERHYGSFERSFTLPESVDDAAISASFEKGVLNVTLPKREEVIQKPRKISIG